MELTHASFFSGVGGLDLGLERAGWRTVSFSEIDPYASAVLAKRWPGVPNLGDITSLRTEPAGRTANDGRDVATDGGRREAGRGLPSGSANATLWSGGFPCQDLSVAGKRAGFAGERSGLAFAFLDLVEQHRPPAILLENVPGLLSSNRGRDFGTLLDRLGQLGYWWAYRILDAQFFGVPQRRRRVFICALHAGAGFGADSAAAVLSVGARCGGHPAAGDEAGEGVADESGGSTNAAGVLRQSVNAKWAKGYSGPAGDEHHNLIIAGRAARQGGGTPSRREHFGGADWFPHSSTSPPSDPGGVREADGLARRLDDHPLAYRKSARVSDPGSPETWVDDGLANTLNSFDVGDIRTTHIALGGRPEDDLLLPLGLDSHRYRCCGNGVVSNVSEWIGWRLRSAVESVGREAA